MAAPVFVKRGVPPGDPSGCSAAPPAPIGCEYAERVLLLAPTRRDGEVTSQLLKCSGVPVVLCSDLYEMAAELQRGLGALMLTDVALTEPGMEELIAALQQQPTWSDIPVVLLIADRDRSPKSAQAIARLTNVTLLDRPTSTRTMVSAVLAALRARHRQYDIRDHLQAQQAAREALRLADQRKDEFLATLAHELRNPLAPLRTGLQLMAHGNGGGDRGRAALVPMMERQVGLLVKLIDDLLDVSRISTGKLVLQLEDCDLREVVQAAIEGSQSAIDAGEHQLSVELGERPAWVRGDPSRLAQAVSNLLNNASKYTPRRGRVAVSIDVEPGAAVVRVSDNGVGIPADMLDGVFDMFTQVNRTLHHAQGGLGIGLSLVRRMVAMHGGTVSAASDGLERGSTFTIRLPTIAPRLPAIETAPVVADARRSRRVLVVDDNVDAADALVTWLELAGHTAQAVYSGEQALDTVAGFRPEVVLCDIGLPGLDGHQVALALRADPRHAGITLVALTGWGSRDDKRRTSEAGFDYHLVKPVRMEAVADILAGV